MDSMRDEDEDKTGTRMRQTASKSTTDDGDDNGEDDGHDGSSSNIDETSAIVYDESDGSDAADAGITVDSTVKNKTSKDGTGTMGRRPSQRSWVVFAITLQLMINIAFIVAISILATKINDENNINGGSQQKMVSPFQPLPSLDDSIGQCRADVSSCVACVSRSHSSEFKTNDVDDENTIGIRRQQRHLGRGRGRQLLRTGVSTKEQQQQTEKGFDSYVLSDSGTSIDTQDTRHIVVSGFLFGGFSPRVNKGLTSCIHLYHFPFVDISFFFLQMYP